MFSIFQNGFKLHVFFNLKIPKSSESSGPPKVTATQK